MRTRPARGSIACLAVTLVAAALLLSACGGGGDDASGTDASPTVTAPTAAGSEHSPSPAASAAAGEERAAEKAAEAPAQRKKRVARERYAYERKRYGRPSKQSAGFRHIARQGVLKHLPEFGSEAKSSEREQAQDVLAVYLGAADAGEWSTACKYLLPYYVTQLEASARAATGAPRDCAEALQPAYEQAGKPGPRFPDPQMPRVTSFRVEPYPADRAAELELDLEAAGIALMHASNGVDYYASMTREGGVWKLTVPMPRLLGLG